MATLSLKKIATTAPKTSNKDTTKLKTAALIKELQELQNVLMASATNSVLLVIQGLDASGKDGLVKNVLGSINPQGVTVKSFKAPTAEELRHDILWRIHKETPEKGMIKVFNRSHYEDILITRVHGWCDDATATKRIKAINDFENLLTQHGNTTIIKVYLHISQEEQHIRLKERMTDPTKMWKYNENDWKESELWSKYHIAYEDCITQTSAIPWHIIPADQNWYKENLVANLLVAALKKMDLKYPTIKTL